VKSGTVLGVMSGPLSPLRPGHDHIDFAAAAFGTDQPLTPIEHGHFGAVPLGHLGRVGLDLMAAILAPNDQPDAGGGSIAEPSSVGRALI
jgi:hypothetical protein